jgi:hypothetical protein
LEQAKDIVIEKLGSKLLSFTIIPDLNRLKIEFTDGSILYIGYNKFGEYGYQLLFTSNELDRVRFDSMDALWSVGSKPNHFHPRFVKEGFNSPMVGDPVHDITILCDLILSGDLKKSEMRF